jgi:sugar/nucleoside kinase (ribokinase family)
VPKIHIVGHVTIDKIIPIGTEPYESVGGPPTYMGILLSRLGATVTITTRVGRDFGNRRLGSLRKHDLAFTEPVWSDSPTTRFEIRLRKGGSGRSLTLISKCSTIDYQPLSGVDATILAPVIGELPPDSVKKAASNGFVYVDPQGFLRESQDGYVRMRSNPEFAALLPYVDAMKVDIKEGKVISGKEDPRDIARFLLSRGVKEVLITQEGRVARFYHNDHSLKAEVPYARPADGVGAGDLFGAAYTYYRLSGDPERALRGAVAAASSRISFRGLEKIPLKQELERQILKVPTRAFPGHLPRRKDQSP